MKRAFGSRRNNIALRFMARARCFIEAVRLLLHIRGANASFLLEIHRKVRYNKIRKAVENLNKSKKIFAFLVIAVLCLIISFHLILVMPKFEHRTWQLSYAQQADAPHFVVAHNAEYDFSNDESGLYDFSEPIELTLEANDGKLLLIDKTNGKTYEGTYEVASARFGKLRAFAKKSYTVVIDGLQGTASFSSNRTLFVSIGGYYLNFEIK